MRKPRTPRILTIARPTVAALVLILGLAACSSPAAKKAPLEALFDEGRDIFYNAVAAGVATHPEAGRLTAAERAKVAALRDLYPRLYALMMNYLYPKDAPAFDALLAEGSEASMARF